MTIINHQSYYGDTKLTFGVPLEDIFPNGDIHPSLLYFLNEIYEQCKLRQVKIRTILSNDVNITYYEYKRLKDALELGKIIDYMPISTLFLMLKHFLRQLPLPLLPKYTDGKTYTWLKLAKHCQMHFQSYMYEKLRNRLLVEHISEELIRLPSVNLLLIGYLINFFRSLMISKRTKRIDIKTASTFVGFFSASLFIRMYDENASKDENWRGRVYHPLMLYLMIKWPEIQLKCMEKSPHCFRPQGKTLPSAAEITLDTNLDSVSMQQHAFELETISELSHENKKVNVLHTKNTQTSQQHHQQIITKVCCDSKVTQTVQQQRLSVQTQTESDIDSFDELIDGNLFHYNTKRGNYPDILEKCDEFHNNDAYFYDDYNDLLLSSPATQKSENVCNNKSPSHSDKYKLCYDEEEDDDSDKSMIQLPSSSNINNEHFDDRNSVDTPLNSTSKRKRFSKLKFEFMKMFKERRLLNTSMSADEVRKRGSSIKYEKMKSTKSNLF